MKNRTCARCKEDLEPPVSNRQKYCKDCAYIVDLEKSKRAAKKKRQATSGTFGPNAIKRKDGKINFTAEYNAIQREMKRLGLRKNYA